MFRTSEQLLSRHIPSQGDSGGFICEVTLGISSVNAGIHSLDYYCSAGNGWQDRRVIKAFYSRHL